MSVRSKAIIPEELDDIDDGLLLGLKGECTESQHWGEPPLSQKDALAKFKSRLKDHFYWVQARRCCYCSTELQEHKRTYDLEHVLPRVNYIQFMFEYINLAVACVSCNGRKQARPTLSAAWLSQALSEVPSESDAYAVLHPHIDEWGDYLEFDSLGRIVAKNGNPKGTATIRLCSIDKLNAARISDHFSPLHRKTARQLILNALSAKRASTRQKKLALLRLLVETADLESARIALERLEQEGA